ncbi:MAG: MdtA/MuxA family multidrug efflux RND transporter periplasmic adaptor subunit [Opitutaceae bacterium]|jgi:multidrug efflux system membrane fusion protein
MSHDPTPQKKPEPTPGDRRRRRRIGFIVAVLLVAAVGGIYWDTHTGVNAIRAAGGRGGGRGRFAQMNGPLPVVAQPAQKGDINIYLNGLGTVTPLATVTVRSQISGLLVEIHFEEGQMVNKGDLLAVIDPRPYQVALEQAKGQLLQAQAQLKEAQVDLARYVKLAEQDSIAGQQVDTQRALVTQYEGLVQVDQSAIDSASLNLTYCHITAPVSGRVGLRQVDIGNYVTPGDSGGLVVLAELKPITVIFTLPEDDIPGVSTRINSGIKIPVDAYDRMQVHKLASGTLGTIDNEVDPSTGTFKLRALFPNDDLQLFPNQFVNVRMLLDVHKDATVIPSSAIERGQQGAFVYLVKPDSTVASRAVTLGTTEGERVEVLSGLAIGDRVVTDGGDRLKEGQDVIVQDSENGSSTPPPAGTPGRRRRNGAPGDGGPGSKAGAPQTSTSAQN